METLHFYGLEITPRHSDAAADDIKSAQLEVFEFLRPKPSPFELIRLGGDSDGAYLVPADSLETLEACISPGVKNRKSFEDDLAASYGVPSHMCDKTSSEPEFATPLVPGLQTFRKVWLETVDGPDSISLATWIASDAPGGGDLLLQMDIEGAEYRILLDASAEVLARFRIIVLELHRLDHMNDPGVLFQVLLPLTRKLGLVFTSVHAHPNNVRPEFFLSHCNLRFPPLLEATLLRNDRIPAGFKESSPVCLPHPLDIVKNVQSKPPVFLEDAWRTGTLRP
jgi:hypothetical protein